MKKYICILFIIIGSLYRPWLDIFSTLSSGDWPYLFAENIKESSVFQTPFLWLDPYYRFTAKLGVEYLSLSWEITEKIFWFYPFIIVCLISSWKFILFFLKSFFKTDRLLLPSFIGVLIYTTNTYILMIVGGGQMGVAISYSLAPLVLYRLFKLINIASLIPQEFKIQNSKFKIPTSTFAKALADKQNLKVQKQLIITGIILAIQLMFDPRIFVITIFAGFLFIIFQSALTRQVSRKELMKVILVVTAGIALNLFWILPNFYLYKIHYGDAINAVEVKFLSFAQFSNTISLLHPNWPENLFGKTYFLKPEFLLLPIFAYSSLLFLGREKRKSQSAKLKLKTQNLNNITIKQYNNKTIIFFVFLGIFGSFFAKGVNPPFVEINRLLYENIPGMSIFRDPTKFYLLIALAYSILIPFTVFSIYQWLLSKDKFSIFNFQFSIKSKNKIFNSQNIFLLLPILYLLFIIRPVWMGQLGGTFKPRTVPHEYLALKEFIKKDMSYSPVLWIPVRQRFGFYSFMHPAIDAQDAFGRLDSMEYISAWSKNDVNKFIIEEGIRYIIIPYDSEKEIFISGYTYSWFLRDRTEKLLNSVQWLKKIQSGKIDVYEVVSFDE